MKSVVLIGYSGHAFVVYEALASQNLIVSGYTDVTKKNNNPYLLNYLGSEADETVLNTLNNYQYFVSIGNNLQRQAITSQLINVIGNPINAIHKSAIISTSCTLGFGNLMAPNAILNAQVQIGNGVICNSGSVIEHECVIDDYVHVAPGAILCGNVCVGKGSFIGANSVIKEGIKIGQNVIIGAGTVVIRNIADNQKVVGNSQRIL